MKNMDYNTIGKRYIDIVKEDPEKYYEDYKKLLDKVAKSTAKYKGEPVPAIYQPFFVSEEDEETFKYISDMMMRISDKVTKAYVAISSFRNTFDFDNKMKQLLIHKPLLSTFVPMARYDIFYKSRDEFKFCELNTDGSSAMNEDNEVAPFMLELKAMKEMEKRYGYEFSYYELFDSWVDEFKELYKETTGKEDFNLAIVDIMESASHEEFEKFKKAFEKKGVKTIICDARDIKRKDGHIYCGDFRIDAVYRRLVTFEAVEHWDEIQDFIDGYLNDEFVMIGSFKSQVMHDKRIFIKLFEDRVKKFLSKDELEFIEKHVPYTAMLTSKTFDEVLNNKNKYIIKPVDMNASKGVYVGKDHSKKEFEAILKKFVNTGYIYQEYIEPYKRDVILFDEKGNLEVKKLKSIVGLFIYNKKFKGLYTRYGEENIISSLHQYYLGVNIKAKES